MTSDIQAKKKIDKDGIKSAQKSFRWLFWWWNSLNYKNLKNNIRTEENLLKI